MKYARISFSAMLMASGVFGAKEFSEMLLKLPKDSRIIGFRDDAVTMCGYLFIKSDDFNDVPDHGIPPEIHPLFKRLPDGTVVCESIDYGTALSKTCSHDWANYVGMMTQYEYCKKCGEKK